MWLVGVAANLIFLIIVAVWAGAGPQIAYSPRFAAAVAFATIDFVVLIAMVLWTLLGRKLFGGGGYDPIPSAGETTSAGGGFNPEPTATTAEFIK
jgi:hypothetical protein